MLQGFIQRFYEMRGIPWSILSQRGKYLNFSKAKPNIVKWKRLEPKRNFTETSKVYGF